MTRISKESTIEYECIACPECGNPIEIAIITATVFEYESLVLGSEDSRLASFEKIINKDQVREEAEEKREASRLALECFEKLLEGKGNSLCHDEHVKCPNCTWKCIWKTNC